MRKYELKKKSQTTLTTDVFVTLLIVVVIVASLTIGNFSIKRQEQGIEERLAVSYGVLGVILNTLVDGGLTLNNMVLEYYTAAPDERIEIDSKIREFLLWYLEGRCYEFSFQLNSGEELGLITPYTRDDEVECGGFGEQEVAHLSLHKDDSIVVKLRIADVDG